MVAGCKPGVRSRSSSPEPISTNSERDATPAKNSGKKQSPASCFRWKSTKPAPERNDDTLAESEISDLPTTSLDNIRERFQNCIEPCNQSDPLPAPFYQDPALCGCDETVVNTQRRPDPPPVPRKTPSPVRASPCVTRSPPKNVARNKSPASLFRTTPKKPSPAKGDQEAPLRQSTSTPKKTPVEQASCEPCDSTGESDSYTTPKSIEGMRESLLSVIDGSFCDAPCSESASAAAPVYRDVQCGTGGSLTATDPSRCNGNTNYYPVTLAESYPRGQSRSTCNPSSAFPVNPQDNYSGCGGSSCGFHPSAFPAVSDQSYPVRGQSGCTCDSTQCPVSPPSNIGCSTNACNDATYSTYNQPMSPQPDEDCECECEPGPESTCPAKRSAFQRFRCMFDRLLRPGNASCQVQSPNPYYTFQQDSVTPIPKRLVFNLVPGIPSGPPPCEKPPPPPRKVVRKEAKIERIVANSKNSFDRYTNRVDIYYFDHGNSGYYRTTDNPPPLITDDFLEKSDRYATEFWANIFGVCHVGISYVTIFFLQLFRFVCYSFIRSPIVGFIQILADYVVKPILSILFNGIVQTIFIFCFNTATSFRDLCEPLAQSLGFFLREIAHVFRAIRLVEVNNVHTHSSGHSPKEERCKRATSATRCGPCDVA